jgi:hypothetical protein
LLGPTISNMPLTLTLLIKKIYKKISDSKI